MNLGENTLLVVLGALVTGIAIGRLWTVLTAGRRAESSTRGTSSIHYILGLDLLASRQIDRAIAELTTAARKNTDAIEIYLILGNLLREKGQLERAIQIHQGLLHRPGLSASERAHALLCLGMDFKRAGFRDRAMETFREVVSLDPGNAYALSNLTKIYEEEQDWDRALASQEQLSDVTGELDSTLRAFLYDQIAQTAWRAGEKSKAHRSFEEAIRNDSRIPPPHLHYGDMLESEGELEEAESRWLSFAHDNPRLAYLVFDRLSRVRGKLERSDKMEALYEYVIEKDDKDWRAHVALARLRREQGRDEEAFDLLLRAVSTTPHALTAHLDLWKSMAQAHAGDNRIQRYLDEVARSAFFVDPYICMKCNYRANGVLWRCPHCQEWNTFVEERVETVDS